MIEANRHHSKSNSWTSSKLVCLPTGRRWYENVRLVEKGICRRSRTRVIPNRAVTAGRLDGIPISQSKYSAATEDHNMAVKYSRVKTDSNKMRGCTLAKRHNSVTGISESP
jgi:hypothetical protein